MANFNQFKISNTGYWRTVNGNPTWWLNFPGNVWDALMDAIAAAVSTFVVYSPLGVTVPQTVSASPYTYTAGGQPEIVYISGGSISSVTRNGQAITTFANVTVLLPPLASVVITYTLAPTVVVDK
jgi:hypothetical protein